MSRRISANGPATSERKANAKATSHRCVYLKHQSKSESYFARDVAGIWVRRRKRTRFRVCFRHETSWCIFNTCVTTLEFQLCASCTTSRQ